MGILFLSIYIGAIAILFLSVVMMLNIKTLILSTLSKEGDMLNFYFLLLICFCLFYFNDSSIFLIETYDLYINIFNYDDQVNYIGIILFNNYNFFVYLAAILLLLSLLGSMALANEHVSYFFFDSEPFF